VNLLAGTLYDPAVSVSKATSSLLAMTAIDTTNLRLQFTVPPSGMVRVRLAAVVHGATTFPSILLGVMEGSTVRGRMAPVQSLGNTAVATALVSVEADFIVANLPIGQQLNWDAAYGVETLIASTGLKYGGPNNTTGNDAFGGFVFEIWDPCPAYTPLAGSPFGATPPTTTVHQKLDTIDDFLDTEITDIRNRLPAALVSGRMDCSVGAMAANVITAAAINADAITAAKIADGAIDANTFAAGAINAAAIATGAIDADAIATDAVTEIQSGLSTLDAGGVRAAVGLASANLDTQLGTIAGYIDTEVAAVLAAVDTEVGAIKTQTDKLVFTVANKLDVNVLVVNGVTVGGAGTGANPWGPA
jgi:hypothetical protein